jgi:hypothetical protein
MAELPSSWPTWPSCRWAMGLAVSCLGSFWPGCKKFLQLVFISKISDFAQKLVKDISIDLFVRKICMTYQNAQKNMLYMFMSNSCMFIQL